jgi:hypothetical protein
MVVKPSVTILIDHTNAAHQGSNRERPWQWLIDHSAYQQALAKGHRL